MRDFLYKLVERLHHEGRPLSRNKHFHTFEEAGGRRALRIDRHLRDLEAQLARLMARGERPRVRELPARGAQLVISDPRLLVVRTATLTAEEVALLLRHPAGRWALGSGDDHAGEVAAAARGSLRR